MTFPCCLHSFERHVQLAGRCTFWKVASPAENFFLQALQLQKMADCRKYLGDAAIRHYRPIAVQEGFIAIFILRFLENLETLLTC